MDNNTKKAQNNLREIQMYTRDTKYIIFKNHTHTLAKTHTGLEVCNNNRVTQNDTKQF